MDKVLPIPEYVFQALSKVRSIKKYNMHDIKAVTQRCYLYDARAEVWLNANKDRYMEVLMLLTAFEEGNYEDRKSVV